MEELRLKILIFGRLGLESRRKKSDLDILWYAKVYEGFISLNALLNKRYYIMNKLLLGLFFTLHSVASIAQESVSPDTIWQVKGRVLDKENGEPVPNASIMFFDNG